MKPAAEWLSYPLKYEQVTAFTQEPLKLQNASLFVGWAQLALYLNRPEKVTVPESDFPLNSLSAEAMADSYRMLLQASAR